MLLLIQSFNNYLCHLSLQKRVSSYQAHDRVVDKKLAVVEDRYDRERHTCNRYTEVVYDEVEDQPVMEVLPQQLVSKDRRHRDQIGDQRPEEDDDQGDALDNGHDRCRVMIDYEITMTIIRRW